MYQWSDLLSMQTTTAEPHNLPAQRYVILLSQLWDPEIHIGPALLVDYITDGKYRRVWNLPPGCDWTVIGSPLSHPVSSLPGPTLKAPCNVINLDCLTVLPHPLPV